MTRVPWWGPLVAIALVHVDAAGGIVRGRVTMSAGRVHVAPGEVVISVDSLPRQVPRPSRSAQGVTMTQERLRFVPSVLPIRVGTTIRFQNRDHVYHNVFSVSQARRFDLGKFAPGVAHSVTFDQPGTVQLLCDIHPDETGWVVVLPHRWFTQPDRSGAFKLAWLPAGRYKLRMWHPRLGERTRIVNVPTQGEVRVRLSF